MSHERIYLCLAHMSGKEQDFIKEAFDQNWVVPMGPNVNGFEEDLEKFVNRREGAGSLQKSVCCLSAGTAAVHLALLACGVGSGDEVIVSVVHILRVEPSYHISWRYACFCGFGA